MKKKINVRLMMIAALTIVVTMVLSISVFYELFQKEVIEELDTFVHVLKNTGEFNNISDTHTDYAEDNALRISVIDEDGKVIYDSNVDVGELDNHMDRPEIQMAFSEGEGYSIRKSDTLEKDTFYYAILLDNNTVLRVAKEAGNILSIFESALPSIIIIVITLFVICIFLAHFLTKNILKPIEQVAENIDEIDEVPIYKELVPFINTIRKQHDDIMKNAMMRQEFTANVSHELKTPLTSISGYSELIETGMAAEEDVMRFAAEIHHSSKRLLTLINDIIRLSELDYMEKEVYFEPVDLYKAAEECVNMVDMNAKSHNVTILLTGDHVLVNANKGMIDEVIYNLCDNAIRYNNENGKVIVDVSEEGEFAVLTVKDTGIGIDTEHQERVFERFYRVDKSRSKSTGGTGLGLAIVKHIVANLNAKIELKSEKGKGTEIKVIIRKY